MQPAKLQVYTKNISTKSTHCMVNWNNFGVCMPLCVWEKMIQYPSDMNQFMTVLQ